MSKQPGNERFANFQPGDEPGDWTMNRILRILMGTRGYDGVTARVKPDGLEIRGTGGLNLSKFAFGWVGPGATDPSVVINGGPCQRSNDTIWIAGAEVIVGGDADDHHIIYATSPGVIATSTARKSAWMGHEETAWRVPLYECHLEDGFPVMDLILWNAIDLKTWFAAPP